MQQPVVRSLAGLALLASGVTAQLFEPLPVKPALDMARTEGLVCLIAYRGEEPDPAFEALLASPELAAWADRGALTVLAPAERDFDLPVTLWVDWRPALAAVEPDGERARFRVEDWDPAEVLAWLEEVARGRGRNDELRARLGREDWVAQQRSNQLQMELQLLSMADDLEGLSSRYLEVLSGRSEVPPRDVVPFGAPWGLLQAALPEGRVDDEPWWELLLSHELPLRRGEVDAGAIRLWLRLVDLLEAHERLEPTLRQALDAGADRLLDDSWSLDDDRDHDERRLAGELLSALLRHGTPEGCGALIPDLADQVHDVLGVFGRPGTLDRAAEVMEELDGREGPRSGAMRLSRTMLALGRPMGAAMDAQQRAAALDTVAAAYHAAVVGDRRREARDLTNDALTTVASRAPEHLPDLLEQLRGVDEALRAAGLEPVPWTVPPVGDRAPIDDLEAELPEALREPPPPDPPTGGERR